MDPLATCNTLLKKIMSDNADLFRGDKTIFDYVDIYKGKKIRVYIIDNTLPKAVITDIARYYEVVQYDVCATMPYLN